ncbi:MAG: hypothetical protein JWO63_2173, partial [Frankiales bacterium]|nr:hypothetical protein [Frankiales bacterium]
PRRTLTGQALEPEFPLVAAALAAGSVSLAHAKVIADAVATLPAPLAAEHGEQIERVLLAQAREVDPRGLGLLARRILAHLWPDGPEPRDPGWHARQRGVRLIPRRDGGADLHGRLTPECRAVWEVILASLSELRGQLGSDPAQTGEHPDQLGPGKRTEAQTAHDALLHAGRRLLAAGGLPEHAGLPAALLITLTLTDLEARAGQATTHTGGTLSIPEALSLAADARHIPLVLADGEDGEVLHHGRGRRLAERAQRHCLIARDRGCSFPGCPKTAAQCQVHHAPAWIDGGRTDLDAMTLTCGYHNNEAPRQGWETLMINGIPHWRPPAWIDPDRTPRRNHLHHPELLIHPPDPPQPPRPPQPPQPPDRPPPPPPDDETPRQPDAPSGGPPSPPDRSPRYRAAEPGTPDETAMTPP